MRAFGPTQVIISKFLSFFDGCTKLGLSLYIVSVLEGCYAVSVVLFPKDVLAIGVATPAQQQNNCCQRKAFPQAQRIKGSHWSWFLKVAAFNISSLSLSLNAFHHFKCLGMFRMFRQKL